MRSILTILLLCSAFSYARAQAQVPFDAIARGKALTEAADCAGCHTADSAKPFAGGKRIESPFGAVYSPNLTPDRDTGIGGWSDDDFYRALHEGIAPNGSHYYPLFPYPNFTRMTRDDVVAIRAYLATLQPVHSTTSSPELRWPYSYRALMRAWDWLFFQPRTFIPNPDKSAEWNRGAYLVRGRGALWRLPHAEELARCYQARPRLWRLAGGGLVRTTARRRGTQRFEILERRRPRRISAEPAAMPGAMRMGRWPMSSLVRPRRCATPMSTRWRSS